MVGDSPDTGLFIELSSYVADLTEAQQALDLAIRGKQEGSPLDDARAYLIGFAVVAYCRAVMHSNVRRRLTDHVAVPADLVEIHNHVKNFRNATVAHSQSDLAVTYPVGVLDADSLEVRYVAGVTTSSTQPWQVVRGYQTLVATMDGLLDQAIETVRTRLERQLRMTDPRILAEVAPPRMIEKFAADFNPKTKRPPYPPHPTSHIPHGLLGAARPGDRRHQRTYAGRVVAESSGGYLTLSGRADVWRHPPGDPGRFRRPRPLPEQRRAHLSYTLVQEEPDYLPVRSGQQVIVGQSRLDLDALPALN